MLRRFSTQKRRGSAALHDASATPDFVKIFSDVPAPVWRAAMEEARARPMPIANTRRIRAVIFGGRLSRARTSTRCSHPTRKTPADVFVGGRLLLRAIA